jgi:hypothetical protein
VGGGCLVVTTSFHHARYPTKSRRNHAFPNRPPLSSPITSKPPNPQTFKHPNIQTTPLPHPTMSSSTTPNILAIGLEFSVMVQSISTHLFAALRSRSNVTIATTIDDAMQALTTLSPQAVLLTDAALSKRKPAYRILGGALANYVQTGGGRVIMCGVFSSMVPPKDFDEWILRRWGLHWEFGDYHRTDYYLNPAGANLAHLPGLAGEYSMKVVSLKGVSDEARIYHPTESSRTQSMVFPSTEVRDLAQAAVAMQKVGEGWLGYVGDVNSEIESTAVVVAMCGLRNGEECYVCEKTAEEMQAMRCARCKKALYCSKECQKGDWKRHKAVCREQPAATA